jgi:tellurite resistance protein TerC
VPVTQDFRGQNFFVTEPLHRGEKPRLLATPLFIVLVLVETTDLIFAVDSIPAIFAVTQKPLLVYTSNVCAILGLRSLYFMLSGVIHRFYLLKIGIALVLVFVGAKMLLGSVFEIPIWVSLIVIALILGGSVAASIAFPRGKNVA